MTELYHNRARRELLGTRARQSALSRFDSRVGLRAWEDLYREVAVSGHLRDKGLPPARTTMA